MQKAVIFFLFGLVGIANSQWGGVASAAGTAFYWHKNGGTPTTDTVRFVEGANVTLTQSGKTLTIASSGGSGISVAQARKNTGWTAQGAAIAQDTVVSRIEWGGTPNTSVKYFDADNDSVIIQPQSLKPMSLKAGATTVFSVDSTGNVTQKNFYAQMYKTSGTISLGSDTWTKITGFTVETSPTTVGITAVADSFTVTTGGNYEIQLNIFGGNNTGASTTPFQATIMVNQVKKTNYTAWFSGGSGTASIYGSGRVNFIAAANVNDDISVIIKHANGDDFFVSGVVLSVKKL